MSLWLLVIAVFWGALPYAEFDTERECQVALAEFDSLPVHEAQQEAGDWSLQCCRPSEDECPFSEEQTAAMRGK